MSSDRVERLPAEKHRNPMKPWFILRALIWLLSEFDMLATKFTHTESRMELVGKQPTLILMNHSSFIDLKIAYKLFFPKPMCIVSTFDSYIGKRWLMPLIGCIPTQKFVADIQLLGDIQYALEKKKCNVLMFPEAGYSLDGRATALPSGFGMLIKRLNVPIVSVSTDGAFLRQPLYNELKTRKVKTTAHVQCLLTPDEIKEKSVKEIDEIVASVFGFDNFKAQLESKTVVDTPDRAKGLERVLYRCPNCQAEGEMNGEGTAITCKHCGKSYEMDVFGQLRALDGETEFSHIPDWFDWQRECVKNEIINKEYHLETEVKIGIIKDYKCLYRVGEGTLIHDENGFTLTGCDGQLEYTHSVLASHTLNVDFYWYTIGDTIGIGNRKMLYYCFPKQNVPVAKVRLAAEELYKLKRAEKRRKPAE